MNPPLSATPWGHVRNGFIGLLILGGLGTAFAFSLYCTPELREKLIARALTGVDSGDLRATAQATALRYESLPQLLFRFAALPAAAGLASGMCLSRLLHPADTGPRRRWLTILLGLTTPVIAFVMLAPLNRGLVFHEGKDQFDWIDQLQSGPQDQRQPAVAACVELLQGPPFHGRIEMMSSLSEQKELALPAVTVLQRLQYDADTDIRRAAEWALARIVESWEQQLDAVRGGVSKRIELTQHRVTDSELRDLLTDCDGLEVLLLDDTNLSTAALQEVLPKLPRLRRLKLGGRVEAAAFDVFAQLSQLEVLNLPNAECDANSLAALRSLPELNLLRIASYGINDSSLPAIQDFPKLKYLHLISTSITDDGLMTIAAAPRLQSFYLDGSFCTEQGLSKLLENRTDLHVHWNDLHLDGDPGADQH